MALRTKWKRGDQFLVRHLDGALLVVEKRAGLLTHSTPTSKGPTLHGLLREFAARRRPRAVLPVHRLDRVVSGLLVYARTEAAQRKLIEQFKEHSVERRYLAAVQGRLEEDEGTIRRWLFVEDKSTQVYAVSRRKLGAKRAVTHWKVLERFRSATLVEVRLETGVKNQIRVHFADAGHPLLGEKKYGDAGGAQGGNRIFLHAQVLGFVHPITRKSVRWEAKLPDDLERWKKKL